MIRSALKSSLSIFVLTTLFVSSAGAVDVCLDLYKKNREKKIEPRNVSLGELNKLPDDGSKLRYNPKLQLSYVFQLLEHDYGPLQLKQRNINLDWAKLKRDTLKQADKVKNTNEEYEVLANLMFAMKDAHVSVEFPSTLEWTIPLQTRNLNRKLLVNFVDGTFPEGIRKPGLADELVAINGQKIDDFQAQFGYFNALGNPQTDRSIFANSIGRWREQRGLPLSRLNWSEFNLTFRSDTTGELYSIKVPITKQGTGLIGSGVNGNRADPAIVRAGIPQAAAEVAPQTSAIVKGFHELFRAEVRVDQAPTGKSATVGAIGKKTEIGAKDPFFQLPADFKPIVLPKPRMEIPVLKTLMDVDFLTAGTFMRNGERVGFLRIPSYSPENLMTILPALRFYMAVLKQTSDYVVVDQTNNPGGYVIFSDWVVKSLNGGQYDTANHLKFAVKPTQDFIRNYTEMIDQLRQNKDGLLTKEEAEGFAKRLEIEVAKIESALREDKQLSEPISMLAVSDYVELSMERMYKKMFPPQMLAQVYGNAAPAVEAAMQMRFSYPKEKDVYFMINEFDFSGGDATPASLQDYGRAYLVGIGAKRTAGAGGTVEKRELEGQLKATLHLTTSLMARPGGRTVEGSGVHARNGLVVPLTKQDIKDGYAGTFDRAMSLINGHRAARQAQRQQANQ